MGAVEEAQRVGREADRRGWLDVVGQVGFVAYGIVHLLIAWVAVELVLSRSGEHASAEGALAHLAAQPFGRVLVWAVAGGLFLLVAWRIVEVLVGPRGATGGGERLRRRLASAGAAGCYGVLGAVAVSVATGGGGSSDHKAHSFTARVLDWPAGQWIVAAVGLGILVSGAVLVWRGCTDDFLDQLDPAGRIGTSGTVYAWLGRAGHVSKGVAIGIVGCLFGYAAMTHEPRKSGGLDQALRDVLQQPYGPLLLLAIAAGIGCFGLFCFARSRHLSR